MDPNFFKPWLIGTSEYPLDSHSIKFVILIGFFGWVSQESLALSLASVKSGTVACFQNVPIFFGFVVDIFYFKR